MTSVVNAELLFAEADAIQTSAPPSAVMITLTLSASPALSPPSANHKHYFHVGTHVRTLSKRRAFPPSRLATPPLSPPAVIHKQYSHSSTWGHLQTFLL